MEMRMQKNRMIFLMTVLLGIILLGWRLYPCSIDQVISTSKESINSLACNATVTDVASEGLFMDTYVLPSAEKGDADVDAVLDILSNTRFRQDFRNLLPWSIHTVDDDGTHNGKSANVLLVWGDSNKEVCYIMFHSDRVVSVDTGSGRFLIYHPTHRKVLDELTDYIQMHGAMNE